MRTSESASSAGIDEDRGTVRRCLAQATIAIRHVTLAVQVRPIVLGLDVAGQEGFPWERSPRGPEMDVLSLDGVQLLGAIGTALTPFNVANCVDEAFSTVVL